MEAPRKAHVANKRHDSNTNVSHVNWGYARSCPTISSQSLGSAEPALRVTQPSRLLSHRYLMLKHALRNRTIQTGTHCRFHFVRPMVFDGQCDGAHYRSLAPNDLHPIDDRHILISILLASASPYFNITLPEHITVCLMHSGHSSLLSIQFSSLP
ncbi:hypothetical protein P171DRAFT_179765 [Karstenula rhodostoma CBS 690.94]|uniref:Uncharacterized protein n=1 Tax=Karstenula rhodostoma CBS 690.94 TaxID=1392251 RepID=A0A9P4U616_9PLEO|nr:hypothetical protein P171DRAFT_179765 [Karstenula rhodostoma CBS 690.94]